MFAELETARLNVEEKNRSNLFNWRGQFTPQFIDYLLETYARPGQRVLDPFCGSGTVLQEAAAHRLAATGLEINPAAYAMAKFFSFAGLSQNARREVIRDASEVLFVATSELDDGLPLFRGASDGREEAAGLLEVAVEVLARAEDKQTKLLLLLALFRADSGKNGNAVATVTRAFHFLADCLLQLPATAEAPVAALADARNAHLFFAQAADVILTSPPYINVFNYHQNHRALLELVGFDMLQVAQSEIGANRKHRGNRFLTVIQYCLDLEMCLNSFAQALAPDGLLILVLGRESRVRGIPFGNATIAEALLASNSAYSRLPSHERVFVNRFGWEIFEDILIARRTGAPAMSEAARGVATSALQRALGEAEGEVRVNLEEAVRLVESVQASPIFNKTALL